MPIQEASHYATRSDALQASIPLVNGKQPTVMIDPYAEAPYLKFVVYWLNAKDTAGFILHYVRKDVAGIDVVFENWVRNELETRNLPYSEQT